MDTSKIFKGLVLGGASLAVSGANCAPANSNMDAGGGGMDAGCACVKDPQWPGDDCAPVGQAGVCCWLTPSAVCCPMDMDAGNNDAGNMDAGNGDAGNNDAGNNDAGNNDAGNMDAGNGDAGNNDAGLSCTCTQDPNWPGQDCGYVGMSAVCCWLTPSADCCT